MLDAMFDKTLELRHPISSLSDAEPVQSFPATADATFLGHVRTLRATEIASNQQRSSDATIRIYSPIGTAIVAEDRITDSSGTKFRVVSVDDPHGQGMLKIAECVLEKGLNMKLWNFYGTPNRHVFAHTSTGRETVVFDEMGRFETDNEEVAGSLKKLGYDHIFIYNSTDQQTPNPEMDLDKKPTKKGIRREG